MDDETTVGEADAVTEGTDTDLALDSDTDGTDVESELEAPASGDEPEGDTELHDSQDDDEPKFTVTVDGDEVEVTLEELTKSYMRQSDYTRKTQDVARQREEAAAALRLYTALQENPQATLAALAQHLGTEDTDDDGDLDPVEQRLQQHEQFIEQQEERQFMEWLTTEVGQLSTEFGEEIDPTELAEFAVERNVPDLRAAYLLRRHEAERAERVAKANKDAAARARKAPKVAGGSRAAGTTAAPEKPIASVADALDAALAEAGVSWD